MSEWRVVPLGDLYSFRSGLSKPRSAFGSGYGFLSFKDVFYNYFVPEDLTELVESTEHEREVCSVHRGDVFLTRTSETMEELGMSCVALRDYPNATFNGFTKRLRPKKDHRIVPEYAAYYFRSPTFRRDVTAMSSLSTRASLNNDMLERLTMLLPEVDEQERIGCILKGLDDKIELSRRMNRTLEAIARAIFKSWFVDFDPVHAKADGREPVGMDPETAALFPDSFQDSPLGKIPKGWEVAALSEIADFVNGAACQKYPAEPGEPSLPVIKIRELGQGVSAQTDRARLDIPEKHRADDGDVLFSWSGTLLCKIWTGGPCFVNQHLFKVTSANHPRWFFLRWINRHLEAFREVAAGKATTMGHIKRSDLSEARVLIPGSTLLGKMTQTLSPIVEKQIECQRESRLLQLTRDALLPKLLSGALRIDERHLASEVYADEA